MADIRDEHGNKVGSIEKKILSSDDYNTYDEYGRKTGSVEKKFLSNDYDVRDKYGNKTGTVEKNVFTEGYTVRGENGQKVGTATTTTSSSWDGSGGGALAIAILVVGVIVWLSFKSLGESLSKLFVPGEPEFYLVLFPAVTFIVVNVIDFFRRKWFYEDMIILKEFFAMGITYVSCGAAVIVIGILTGADFWTAVGAVPLMMIFKIATALVVFVPLVFIISISVIIIKKNTQQS